jgi:hypothetical protein
MLSAEILRMIIREVIFKVVVDGKAQGYVYIVEGGNVWNHYIVATNEDHALQFERLENIK